MATAPQLEQRLREAFPSVLIHGEIAPHRCEDCDALRECLRETTWDLIPPAFIDSNDGSLPLLTQEAYVAYLPAWLRRALQDPDGPVAGMLLVNLRDNPNTEGFSRDQAVVVCEIARYIAIENALEPDDPVNAEALAAIELVWARHAA